MVKKQKKKVKGRQKITKDMDLASVINKYPQIAPIFFRHGLGCVGCPMAMSETIEQGAKAHGINVKKLIDDLNKAVK